MEFNIKDRISTLNRRKARLDEKLENIRLPKRDFQRYNDELESVEEELFNLEGATMYRRINVIDARMQFIKNVRNSQLK